MSATSTAFRAGLAVVLLATAGCGGGGGDTGYFPPTGPITVTVFGQHTASNTSPTNPLQIAPGTSVMVHLYEDTYAGNYSASVTTSPPGSTCITIAPPVSDYVFTISANAAAACVYPQTASIVFSDNYANTTTLYVEGT